MRRHRILSLVSIIAVVVLVATGVAALGSRGSREFTGGAGGVIGPAEAGDLQGVAVAVGNFDGDRFDDVLVGAPFEDLASDTDAGQVQVFYGTRDGLDAARDRVIHQGTALVVGASDPDDLFGSALAVGDFDGDGFDDAAVGVPGKDLDGFDDAGKVVILYGTDAGLTGRRSLSVSQRGGLAGGVLGTGHRFGQALTVGNFNGDDFADLAVGEPGALAEGGARAGGVSVLLGSEGGLRPDTAVWFSQDTEGVGDGAELDDRFGSSLTAGDFNGDGVDELAVGAPGESIEGRVSAGLVQVFDGSVEGLVLVGTTFSEDSDGVADGAEASDRFGSALAAGDFDADGHDDLAVGVPNEAAGTKTATGSVQVLRGSSEGLTTVRAKRLTQAARSLAERPEPGDDFGAALVVGRFDRGRQDDLAVGVPGERVGDLIGAGLAHVFFGSDAGISAKRAQTWQPGVGGVPGRAESNAAAGRALAAGDLDGDGTDDLVIGIPGRTVSGDSLAGSFLVLYG